MREQQVQAAEPERKKPLFVGWKVSTRISGPLNLRRSLITRHGEARVKLDIWANKALEGLLPLTVVLSEMSFNLPIFAAV